MRKQTKLAVGLSAAALLAIGATMTSFAARGWTVEGDQWYYYDNNGDYVTDKWKSYNGNYFYLGSDGYMLTNELIEDGNNYYYVDANGAMVKNAWVPVPADDSEDLDVEYRWYYFGSNGKAFKANPKKTINGKKYGFDEEGKMLFGFVNSANYEILNESDDAVLSCDRYYGTNEDGAMYTGWLLYTDALDAQGYDDQYYWFHFKSNGIKRADTTAKINGKQYTFDANGVMLHDWKVAEIAKTATGAKATAYGYFSNEDDGSLQKSRWVWSDTDIWDVDGDDHWYWVNKNGERFVDGVKKINGKYYSFDADGIMQWGLVILDKASVKATGAKVKTAYDPQDVTAEQIYNEDHNLFFFSTDEEKDGSMKTGTNVKIELWDDTYTFGFDKNSGKAYDGATEGKLQNNKLFVNGILITADDQKYEVVSVDGKQYLVSSNGTVMKVGSRVYKDADDNKFKVTGGDAKKGFTIECTEGSMAVRTIR